MGRIKAIVEKVDVSATDAATLITFLREKVAEVNGEVHSVVYEE